MISRFLLIMALVLVTGVVPAASRSQISELVYADNYKYEHLDTTDDGIITFRIVNNNNRPPTEEESRVTIYRYVAVPPGSQIQYIMRDITWRVIHEDGTEEGPFSKTEQSSIGGLPSNVPRASGRMLGTFRSIGLAQCGFTVNSTINTGAPDYDRVYVVADEITVEARISGDVLDEEPHPTNLEERDPYLIDFANELVINPGDIGRFTRKLAPMHEFGEIVEWNRQLKEASTEGPVLLARVAFPGLYRITPKSLLSRGIESSAFTGNRIRVFAGNKELPLIVRNTSGGPFVGETEIYVYVPEMFPKGAQFVPVWIMQLDGGTAPHISEIEPEDEVSEADSNEGIRLTASKQVFEPNEYHRKLPFQKETGQWATRFVDKGSHENVSFDLESLDEESSGTIAVSYAGLYSSDRFKVQLYINGNKIGRFESFSGLGPFKRQYTIPGGILKNGRNDLSIYYPDQQEQVYGGALAFNFAEVEYPVDIESPPTDVPLTLAGDTGEHWNLTLTSPYAEEVFVLDITNPQQPKRLSLGSRNISTNERIIKGLLPAGPAPRKYFISRSSSAKYFGQIEQTAYEELLEPKEGADLVVIAHPELIPGIHDYVSMRRREGLKVHLQNSQTIMNQFNFGGLDYRPIKDYLQYAFRNWPDERISQVLIVGEASEYPWEVMLPNEEVAPNQVPAYGFFEGTVTVQCDDSYAQMNEGDLVTDLEIGRFSAKTPGEVRSLTQRIWEYETNPPAGPWLSRHLFVTDDEPEFARVAERIIQYSLQNHSDPKRLYLQDYPYEDYFRLRDRKRSIAMTKDIISQLSDGALTATYIGHGGPNLWSGERIFHYRDIPSLKMNGKLPIMAAASCDTAWIDYPLDPVRQSIGEQLLLNEDGGCISLFAPVAGTSSYEHDHLLRPFFKSIASRKFDTVGAASLYSKLMYLLERNTTYVSNQFILLGDPALRIPQPTNNIKVQVSPRDIFVNQESPLAIRGTTPTIRWGMVEATLYDQEGRTVAGPKRIPIKNGTFESKIALQPFMQSGTHRLLVQAFNGGTRKYESVENQIEVRDPELSINWQTDPPAGTVIPAGQPVQLTLRAKNNSEGYMDELLMRITNVRDGSELTSAPLVLRPDQEVQWQFRIPTPPGITVIEADVNYRHSDERDDPIARSLVEIRGQDPSLPAVTVIERLAAIERLATPERTTFELPLYNMRNEPLSNVKARLYLLDKPEGTPVGEEASIPGLAAQERTSISFEAKARFPTGRLPFKLEVTAEGAESKQMFEQTLEPLVMEITQGMDIEVVPGSVRTERNDYVMGHTVYVLAKIRNLGSERVDKVKTTLYVDYPWEDGATADAINGAYEQVFDSALAPGEVRDVRLRWDPPPGSNLNARLYVVANSDRNVTESDYTNNMGDVAVSLLRLPNLALQRDKLRVSQTATAPGEIVGITVPYENNSPFNFAHYFVIEIRAQGEDLEDKLVYRALIDHLDAGERGVIQAAWQADGERDRIHISVNDDRDYGEQEITDNLATIELDYLLNENYVELADGNSWSFGQTFRYGDRTSVIIDPDGSLTLPPFPSVRKSILFEPDFAEGRIPSEESVEPDDNAMGIIGGNLIWTPYETPRPVTFRIPMPKDDHTTEYDIYFSQLRPNRSDNMPVNEYRYLLEDEKEWQRSQRNTTNPYLGRVETRDDFLDVTFASTSVPSWVNILSIDVAPIEGTYEAPLFEIAGMPAGTVEHNALSPHGTKILYEYRLGTGDALEPNYGSWMRVEPGDHIPEDKDANVLQWRAHLVGEGEVYPSLYDVMINLDKGANKLAQATDEQ